MPAWKRLLITSTGAGAGVAIVVALLVGFYLWWTSRPLKVPPWNENAIVASYDRLTTEGDNHTLDFTFTLENRTDSDYRVDSDSSIHLAAFLEESQALSFTDSKTIHTDYPIYIPAKNRVQMQVHMNYPSPEKQDYEASDAARHDYYTRVAQYAVKELSNVDGFVMLDEVSRYKIILPNGWAARAKEPMRLKRTN